MLCFWNEFWDCSVLVLCNDSVCKFGGEVWVREDVSVVWVLVMGKMYLELKCSMFKGWVVVCISILSVVYFFYGFK